ncbi:long chain acyl-CoA synthetase 6, peroxisomal-like protein [Tanacetum coccineum]|uniref:Long chain acyl-CoA synthetase 6, peroxisomal-like protein n=1 Tax=Tanacetum coccineum TaxID=301880 RepID=A0ABQ5GI39_9ASTR
MGGGKEGGLSTYNQDFLFENSNQQFMDVKRKSTKDKVRCEKVFDVDEFLDIKNLKASSIQVKGIPVDETKSMCNDVVGFDSIKELYASDEDFRNSCMELKTKKHGEQGYNVVLLEKLQTRNWNVYRTALSPLKLVSRFHDHLEIAMLHDILLHAVETYGDNKYLGTRFGTDGIVREYKWITYREACIAWLEVGSGLLYHGIPKGSTGLHFNSRPEWVIVDNACFTYSYISILLYDAISLDAATFILNLVTMQVIFCVPNTLKDLLSYLLEIPYVCLIMVVGTRYDELTSL